MTAGDGRGSLHETLAGSGPSITVFAVSWILQYVKVQPSRPRLWTFSPAETSV